MLQNLDRATHYSRTVKASSTETANGNSSSVRLPNAPNAMAFILDVTSAGTDAGDTLDVKVETKLDGSNWVSICAFTQITGDGGAKRHVAKVVSSASESMFEDSSSLSAGSVRNLLGDAFRVSWTIADSGDGDQSFTFSVSAIPM